MNKFSVVVALAALLAPGIVLAQTAAAPAFGEAHARSAMTGFGCSNISSLSPGPAGSWYGTCAKAGATTNVMMDAKGVVTAGGTPMHETEPMARSAALGAGCSNVTGLSAGPNNSWHGQCAKGGATVNVAVDSKGTVMTGQPTTHLTEGHARSILTQAGCSNISSLNAGADGSWMGMCAKAGKTSNVAVDSKGAVTVQ